MFHFDTPSLERKVKELDAKMTDPQFWDDQMEAQRILKESKALKRQIEMYNHIETQWEEMILLAEMAITEKDESLYTEVKQGYEELTAAIDKALVETLLSGEFDSNNAILSIHAGSGGLDAQDWADMLLRMYVRFGEKAGYKVKILDMIKDTEAGIKNATILVEGDNAYGYLKSEKGVHRMVRISPFDSSGKRHTSFSSVDVMPELDDSVEVDINQSDLKIDTYRASGAGGQHINTTDSAVRITHMPTGIVVQCQNERSQITNRATAMKMLMAKLIELKELEQKDRIEDLAGDYSQISWGSQIRSYVFHPYNLVKDHRTNAEIGNVQSVMDGSLDTFIDAYLKWKNNN